jgi:hypothetical protein
MKSFHKGMVELTTFTEEKLVREKNNICFVLLESKFYRISFGLYDYKTIPEYNQQDATFLDLFISTNCSTCFRVFLRPSSGAQNCTYSVRYCQPIRLPAAIVAEMERSLV